MEEAEIWRSIETKIVTRFADSLAVQSHSLVEEPVLAREGPSIRLTGKVKRPVDKPLSRKKSQEYLYTIIQKFKRNIIAQGCQSQDEAIHMTDLPPDAQNEFAEVTLVALVIKPDGIPFGLLDLNSKTVIGLVRELGLKQAEDLSSITERRLAGTPNIGKAGIVKIKKGLEKFGLSLLS